MQKGHHIIIIIVIVLLVAGAAPARSQTPEADSLKKILGRLLEQTRQRDSEQNLDSKRSSAQNPSDTIVAWYLNEIAYSVRNIQHDTALVYANQALLRSRQIGFRAGEARAKMIIGIVAIYEGHYNAGLDAHIEAIELYKSLGDSIKVAFLLNNIGYLYKSQGKLPIAKDYFIRSLGIFRTKAFNDGIALVLGNLGDVALKRSEYDEALHLEREALMYAHRASEKFYAQLTFFHLGTVFYAKGELDSALYYQQKALANFEQSGFGQYVVRALENLAAIYAAKKQYDKALQIAYRGVYVADSISSPIDLALVYERLSLLYEETANHKQALEYYRLTASLRDSLTSLNIAERMQTLDLMRVSEKNAKDLALAEKEQTRLESWRNYLIIGIVFTVVLLLLAVQRYRFIARSEASLREVNNVILKQQAQLEEQSKHIQETNVALELSNRELDAKNERLIEVNGGLEQANERLAALNYEKDEVLGIVAHDLRNPLTTIMMSASSLLRDELPQERITMFGSRMLQSSERMLNIITKLLNVNALEQGAKNLQIQFVDITETLRTIIEGHQGHAEAKEIHVEFSVSPEVGKLQTDESIVAEIFENLLDNALKYSPRGKKVWIAMEKDHSSNGLRITIRDEGPGFTEADKQKVFGKFARLSAKPTGGEESTGLGLAIVKKLAEMLGGRVELESESGKGAVFTVVLPNYG